MARIAAYKLCRAIHLTSIDVHLLFAASYQIINVIEALDPIKDEGEV